MIYYGLYLNDAFDSYSNKFNIFSYSSLDTDELVGMAFTHFNITSFSIVLYTREYYTTENYYEISFLINNTNKIQFKKNIKNSDPIIYFTI